MNITASQVKDLREKSGAGMMDCKKALTETNGDMDAALDYLREKGIMKANKKAERIAAEGLAAVKVDGNKAIIIEVNSETDFVSQNDNFKNLVDQLATIILNSNATTVEEALEAKDADKTVNDIITEAIAKIGEKISLRRFEIKEKTENQAFGEYLHMGGQIAALNIIEGTSEEVAKDVAMHIAAMKPKYATKEDVDQEEVEAERKILKEQAVNEGKPENIAEKMVEGRIKKFFQEICLEEQAFIKDGDVTIGKYLENNNSKLVEFSYYEVGEGMEKREDNFAEEVMSQING